MTLTDATPRRETNPQGAHLMSILRKEPQGNYTNFDQFVAGMSVSGRPHSKRPRPRAMRRKLRWDFVDGADRENQPPRSGRPGEVFYTKETLLDLRSSPMTRQILDGLEEKFNTFPELKRRFYGDDIPNDGIGSTFSLLWKQMSPQRPQFGYYGQNLDRQQQKNHLNRLFSQAHLNNAHGAVKLCMEL